MTESLWDATARDLLTRTASTNPTPGGGSIAALVGAFGVALIQMAIEVTDDDQLRPQRHQLAQLQELVALAVDRDVADFAAVMAAVRLPRGAQAEREHRSAAIEQASILATESPLDLVANLVSAVQLAAQLEAVVKPSIVSDVLAGRDLALGAAFAAIRTVDINLAALERAGSREAGRLRARRDHLAAAVEASA